MISKKPEDVRTEVRRLKRIYGDPSRGLLIALGNGITNDIPLKNLEALFASV